MAKRLTFAEKLRRAREKAGISQSDAAARAGVSQPHWAHLELGMKDPTERIAKVEAATRRLAMAVNVSLDELLPPRAREK